MGKRELVALLNLSSWCLVMVEWLFFAVPRGCLQFVIVVFSDHTHLLFLIFSGKNRNLMHISVSYAKGIRNISMKSYIYRNSTCEFFQVNLYKLLKSINP